MAAIRRVLSSVCQGPIVVLLALLVGLAVPASAVADVTVTPSSSGAPPTLADTGIEGSAMLMAFAGLILLFGIALLAVRRRD
jgi:LPXTG-motif cell wall-anchored protein